MRSLSEPNSLIPRQVSDQFLRKNGCPRGEF